MFYNITDKKLKDLNDKLLYKMDLRLDQLNENLIYNIKNICKTSASTVINENDIDSKLNLTSVNQFEREATEKFIMDNSNLLVTLNNNISYINNNILSS